MPSSEDRNIVSYSCTFRGFQLQFVQLKESLSLITGIILANIQISGKHSYSKTHFG